MPKAPGLYRLALASLVCSGLGTGSTAWAQDDWYEQEVDRIENLAGSKADAAWAAAESLRQDIGRQIAREQVHADTAERQAGEYRDLARSARDQATLNRQRAERTEAEARDPLFDESTRQQMMGWAESYRRDADADEARARKYDKRAAGRRADNEARRDEIARLQSLLDRLDQVLGRAASEAVQEVADEAVDAVRDSVDALADQAAANDGLGRPVEELRVEHVLGVWRPISGPQFPFIIVQEDPEFEAYPHRLELHTDQRVWKGEFNPQHREVRGSDAGQPRMVFRRTPQPREMNPEIPDWVAAAIDGKLEWRLEIDEMGTVVDTNLRVRWYRGEVRWTEGGEDGEDQRAWIEGDGVPLIFDLEYETYIDIAQAGTTEVWLEPAGYQGDRVPPQMTAALKGQPFRVKARLPLRVAAATGPRLEITITGKQSGEETTLTLEGPEVRPGTTGTRGVVYSHRGDIVIAEPGSEQDRDPQLLSMDWIAEKWQRSSEEGRRIDLDVDDMELVEFAWQGAMQQIVVYNNATTRALHQHHAAAEVLRTSLAWTVNDDSATAEERDEATRGLRMLANYQALIEREDLLDLHKFYLGELYVTNGINGIRASCMGSECGSEWMKKPIVRVPERTLQSLLRDIYWPAPEPTYFTTLVEGFVEAITGRRTDSAALRTRDAVNWTSTSESALVAGALSTASNETRQVFQDTAGELAYAVPRQLTEEASIILFGRDLRNRRVVGWERGVTMARAAAALLTAVVAEPVAARGIGRLRSSAMRRIGPRSVGHSRVMMRGMRRTASQSGRTPDAAGAPPDLPDELPASLSHAQSEQIFLRMDSGEFDDGPIPGGRTRGQDPTDSRDLLRRAIEEAADHGDLLSDFRRLRDNHYQGTDLRLESERLQPKQDGNTCVASTGQHLANRQGGPDMTLDDFLAELAHRAPDAFLARMRRAQQRVAAASDNPDLSAADRELLVRQRDYAFKMHNRFRNNPVEAFVDLFKDDGVPGALFRDVLRARGADIAVVPARLNSRTSLRHIKAMKDRNYDVVIIIDRGVGGARSRFHAVAVTGFEFEGGRMTRVKFFEPNLGAEVSMNASSFENMIARRARSSDGSETDWAHNNMMVIKWDSEPWPGTSRPAQ